jgi:Glycoside hydrolase family 44
MKTAYFSSIAAYLMFISTDVSAQAISKNLVGTNVWYSDVSKEVWDLTKDCGVTTIRIGGHRYDKKLPSNETLLVWVKNIQAMGAEPVMQMSQYQPAQLAADLVRFFNVEKHEGIKPVRYWSIGNEPWLQANKPPAETFAAVVEAYYKPIAAAMKAVDSTIMIYGPNECDYMGYYNDLFGGKNDIAGKVPGHDYYYCDGLSWHRYPQGNGDPAVDGANDFLVRIKKAKAKVDAVNLQHNRTGKNAMQWGIGEYNSKGGPEVHTWGNGQMFAAVLGYCMEYGATYANTWSMFEHGGDRKGSDFSFIDGAHMTPRASYRHMQLVAKYFTGTFVKGLASTDDFLVYGAQDGDQLSVMIMHRGYGEAKPYSLYLKDIDTKAAGVTLTVKANRNGMYEDIIQPRSTQVLVFKGKSITRINYTSNDFDNEKPPVYTRVKKNKLNKIK